MISVIVPVYNAEKFLVKCVESICNQTYKDLEIILVNDGSTDKSAEICEELAKCDSRIIVLHKENGGSTSARNTGLKIAHGDYIGFVDSDDWIEPDMYEILLDKCISDCAEMSVCARFISQEKDEYTEELCIAEGIYVKTDSQKTIINNLYYSRDGKKRGISTSLCDKLFSRELICKHQFKVDERTKYAEDDICVYSCLLDSRIVSFVNKPLYHYRMQINSVSHSVDDTFFEKISIFYQQMKREFMLHPDSHLLISKLKKYMLNNLLRGINYMFGFDKEAIIPNFLPPYELLKKKGISSIILYGAGNVGRDYYKSFKDTCYVDVVGWVDRKYESYRAQGMCVEPIDIVLNREYEVVLIAVENADLAQMITSELVNLGVRKENILWESPRGLINDVFNKVMGDEP